MNKVYFNVACIKAGRNIMYKPDGHNKKCVIQ